MIPSIQLVATTNGVPSNTAKQHTDVHSEDEFVLPITPNSSPMAVEQSSSIDSQLQSQSIIIDSEQQQQQLLLLQQQQQLQQHSNSNYLQFEEHHLIIHEDILSTCFTDAENSLTSLKKYAQITAHDNINYTIIDNSVSHDGDGDDDAGIAQSNVLDSDEMGDGHNVLMQVIDVPMMLCQSMTPPSQSNTILSNERSMVPNGDEFHNNNNETDNDNNNSIGEDKSMPYDESSRNAVAAGDDGTTEEEDEDDGGSSSEQELTNLGWLIDLKNVTNWPTDTAASSTYKRHSIGSSNIVSSAISNCIIDDIDDDDGCIGPIITDRDLSEERFKKFTIQVKQ